MSLFLDTYALIEIAEGNKKYENYVDHDCVTLKDNLAELFYYLLRKYSYQVAHFFVDKFSSLVVDFPLEYIAPAMLFKREHKDKKYSYIDCFGYCYAVHEKRLFLTGDRAFKGLPHVKILR